MTICMGKSCSFGLPRVPFVNCCKFMYKYLVISLLVLTAGCGIGLYQFRIIAYLFTLLLQIAKFEPYYLPKILLALNFFMYVFNRSVIYNEWNI